METTLLAGDFLLANKASFGARVPFTHVRLPGFAEPSFGDIVIFQPRHDPDRTYVKRIIGMPGDTLEMRGKLLYRNRHPADEPYANLRDPLDAYGTGMEWQCAHLPRPGREPCRPTRDNWGPLVVPAAHYFVLGDNRDASEDSRYWGFVPRAALRGAPLVIYFSRAAAGGGAGIRWQRVGRSIH